MLSIGHIHRQHKLINQKQKALTRKVSACLHPASSIIDVW